MREPRAGDRIEIGNEVALLLSRNDPAWLVLRDDGEVRQFETDEYGMITTCETLWRLN
jgi:hypothetical protein